MLTDHRSTLGKKAPVSVPGGGKIIKVKIYSVFSMTTS